MLASWLTFYQVLTPGLVSGDNTTVRLDLDNEPQPDLLLCLPESAGGAARVARDGYLEGPPELTIEVAASSVSYDLHQKLGVYRRNGVREYLVHRTEDGAVDWFWLEQGTYVRQQADQGGTLTSRVFPGLWLDVDALLRGDLRGLQETVQRGCSAPEHAAFCARLRGE